MDSFDDSEPHLYFNLDLWSKGLRTGHWNVDHLTMYTSKFNQIKTFLKTRMEHLSLNETLLKPIIPDTLNSSPGFTIFICDRLMKNGNGVLAFANDE